MKAVCTALAILAALVPAADTWAATLATFADPSSGDTPLFRLRDTQGTLSIIDGGWAGTGLTLQVPYYNSTYTDATFSISMDQSSTSNGGRIDFFKDQLGTPIPIPLYITWVSGSISEFGMGARDTSNYPSNVTINYMGHLFTNESFAFAFTNYTDLGDGTATVTASFTSSFTPPAVPEPASLILLGLCGAMLAVRRRHR